MTHCIINFSVGGWYPRGQERLKNSLNAVGYKNMLFFNDYKQLKGCPEHKDDPYAFKIYAFEEAFQRGYENVMWVDSSMFFIRDPTPLFECSEKDGYFIRYDGQKAGQWCNDTGLKSFGITREEAMNMGMFFGGLFILTKDNDTSKEFMVRWRKSYEAGAFRGSWKDHRHDLVCGSIVANQLGWKMEQTKKIVAYTCDKREYDKSTVYAMCEGM